MDRSMENGFSSPRTECFPVGLRVLVVDDDPTWLKILEKMLKKCCYEVTTCGLAREALDMLRGRKDGFDIVISDVNMPDMDGFKLLEHVGLEMDLPVIMMSVDGETSRVMKGVQHGACDYLLKPVRMKELKNIWQHVFRKKIHEVKDIEGFDGNEDILLSNGSDKYDDGHYLIGGDISSGKKRKDMESRDYDDQEFTDHSSMKKSRVVWSVDLHQKFVNAVNQIGFDKVGPKKILDLMDVPWLTRENVASHLQKYRLYLSRLQKPNEPKIPFCGIKQQDFTPNEPKTPFCGIKQQDFNPKDPPASALQSSITMHQSSSASSSFAYNGNNVLVQDVGSEIYDDDLKGIISFLPITESRRVPHGDLPDSRKPSNRSQIGLTHSFGSAELDAANNISFGSSHKHSWSRENPFMQLKKQPKRELEQYGYTHLPLPSPPHQNFQAECLQPTPSINFGTCVTERDKAGPSEIKPLSTDYRSNRVKNVSLMDQIVEPFSVQAAEPEILIPQAFGALSTITGLPNMQNPSFNQQHYTSIWESDQRSLLAGSGSTLLSSQEEEEELQLNFLQDYGSIENVELNNIEVSDYHDPELIAYVPSHLYDKLRFNADFLCESMEYPVMDQGLFIA